MAQIAALTIAHFFTAVRAIAPFLVRVAFRRGWL